ELRGLGEGGGEVDARVVDRRQALAGAVPRTFGSHEEALAAPLRHGSGILALRERPADRLGQAHRLLDDGGALWSVDAHGDMDGGPLRREARFILAADGDGDIAHAATL